MRMPGVSEVAVVAVPDARLGEHACACVRMQPGQPPPDLHAVRAFHLSQGEVFVLHRGTWHWGPFPLGPEPVRLLNVQARGYVDDNAHVDLPEALDAALEVVVPT